MSDDEFFESVEWEHGEQPSVHDQACEFARLMRWKGIEVQDEQACMTLRAWSAGFFGPEREHFAILMIRAADDETRLALMHAMEDNDYDKIRRMYEHAKIADEMHARRN